jgi:hypothetical protein
MKKLFATFALAATMISAVAAGSPARAAEGDAPQLLPQLVKPDLGDLKPRTLQPINPQLLLLFKKAELTSQLVVFKQFHPIYNPNPHPHFPVIWCLVRNTGLKDSGPFVTRIKIYRWGSPYVLWGDIGMSINAGDYKLFGVRVYAPYGLQKVSSFADAGYVVPEYQEDNNWDVVP